jgi:hypothetical protein
LFSGEVTQTPALSSHARIATVVPQTLGVRVSVPEIAPPIMHVVRVHEIFVAVTSTVLLTSYQ